MRYRLRTLVILTAVMPPVLAFAWFVVSSLIWLLVRKGDLQALPLAVGAILASLGLCVAIWWLLAPAEWVLARDKEDGPAFYEQELKRARGNHELALTKIGKHYRAAGIFGMVISSALLLALAWLLWNMRNSN